MEAFCSIWREYEGEFDSICKFCLKHNRKLTNPISCFGGSSLFQRILLWRNTLHYNMSPLDLENWDFLAIHRAFCCCVFSLSGFYTAARCVINSYFRLSLPHQKILSRVFPECHFEPNTARPAPRTRPRCRGWSRPPAAAPSPPGRARPGPGRRRSSWGRAAASWCRLVC